MALESVTGVPSVFFELSHMVKLKKKVNIYENNWKMMEHGGFYQDFNAAFMGEMMKIMVISPSGKK